VCALARIFVTAGGNYGRLVCTGADFVVGVLYNLLYLYIGV